MFETELKLHVPEAARRAVDAAVAAAASRRTHLQAIYFDTPDLRLAAAGIALRLRKQGRRWVQTLKVGGPHAMQRLEHNASLPEPKPVGSVPGIDPQRHAGTPGAQALALAIAARDGEASPPLVERYRTDIWRRHRALRATGGVVELAFDQGEIVAEDRRWPVCELEIELLRGQPGAVIDVAGRWLRRHGLWLDVRTKAERGERLARAVTEAPAVKAQALQLDAGMSPPGRPKGEYRSAQREGCLMSPPGRPKGEYRSAQHEGPPVSVELALHTVVANCLQQILPNASEIAAGLYNDEHVHQLRVGLRRLRSALHFFEGWSAAIDSSWDERLSDLFGRLGAARDRDALAASLLPALRAAGAPLIELPPAPVVATPTELLRAVDANLTLLALLGFVARAPASFAAPAGAPVSDGPLSAAAAAPDPSLKARVAERLQRWHVQVVRDAKRYAALDDAARHTLRKRVKRLRYAAEFVAAMYGRKAVARYLARLAPAQDSLGRYNDLCVGLAVYRSAVGDDPRAWFAIGWLSARREVLLGESVAALKEFVRCKAFWKGDSRGPS